MTRREFEAVFSNVADAPSYHDYGYYVYPKTPEKAQQFLISPPPSARQTRPTTHQSILDAAQTWANSCLLSDKSVFTENALWTTETLDEFSALFTDNPNLEKDLDFIQKLEKQLGGGSSEVKQLAAELLWLLFLFPTRFSAEKKAATISKVWQWSGLSAPSPSIVEIAYEPGIGFPGTAFNTQRWRELNFLLLLVIEFKKLEISERKRLLAEPWSFADWLETVDDSDKRQMRHILLHLLFPDHFERIATLSHKQKIVSALTDSEQIEIPDFNADFTLSKRAKLDWDLQAIKSHFSQKTGRNDLDFYDAPLASLWSWGQSNHPESASYAPPFDRLFGDGKADQILDDMAAVIRALEQSEGFKKELLSTTIPAARGSGVRLSINYGRWLIYHYRPHQQSGIFLAVHKDGAFKEHVSDKEGFKDLSPVGKFCLPQFKLSEYAELSDELWEAYLDDLRHAVSTFQNWNKSGYRKSHHSEIYDLITHKSSRAMLLKNGLDLSEEEDIEEEIIDGFLTKKSTPYSRDKALEELFLSKEQFSDILAMLQMKKNIILQGPPGVGKTFIARRLAYALMEEKDEDRAPMVQFHQSYSYEDFIQGYRPKDDGGFELRDGIFHQLCKTAQAHPEQSYFLVIDEINRGNLSKIFGELLMLIEADKRDPSLALQLTHSKNSQDKFYVPDNIHLIGTMNTADRSLSVVDYALRRRFAFITLQSEFKSPKFAQFLKDRKIPNQFIRPLVQALTNLNETIEKDKALGNGFNIGHSFFCPPPELQDFASWYRKVVKFEIAPLLSEYWLDESEKVKAEEEILLQIIE